jgi:hypothetical protein
MRQTFRILLIDDDEAVLKALQSHLQHSISIDDTSRRIEVAILRVAFDQTNGKWSIGADTILELGKLCKTPFDYIFSDYAFVADRAANLALRERLLSEKRDVTTADIQDFVLTIQNIKTRFQEIQNGLGWEVQRDIDENFLRHAGHVQIYTLSPKPFENYFYGQAMSERRAIVESVFEHTAHIDPFILMHDDFCITPDVETAFQDLQDQRRFVTALLSRRLDSLMHIAALEDIVHSQSKLRFDLAARAFGHLTNEALAFGAVVALFGEVVYHFFARTIEMTYDHYAGAWLRERIGASFGENVLPNLLVALLAFALAVIVFRRWGIRLARAVERTATDLTQQT